MASPTYDNDRLSPVLSRGTVYGPSYSTIVVSTSSGYEPARVAQWSLGRYRGTITKEAIDLTATPLLVSFFHARMGKARAFRFQDWSDYLAVNEPLAPTGRPTVQLIKTYTSGGLSMVRPVWAPVISPAVTLRKNAVSFAGFTLDTTSGLVTLNAINSKTISAISQAPSAVVTVGAAHGFVASDLLYFTGIVGMTQLNGLVGTVIATASTTVTVNINSSAFTAYTSGGTATKYLGNGDLLDWSGQYDNVVRFDTDELNLVQEDVTYRSWAGVPLIEVRGTVDATTVALNPPLDPLTRSDLQLYLRSDQVPGSHGAAVASWSDLSSFARTATQGTGGFQPLLQTTGGNLTPNGTRTVLFDGADDLMSGTFGGALANTNGYTVYLYFKELSLTTAGFNLQLGFASNTFEVVTRSSTSGAYPSDQQYGMRGGASGSAPRVVFGPTTLGWQMLRAVWNPPAGSGSSGNMVLYQNGVQVGAGQQWWGDFFSGAYLISNGNVSWNVALGAALVFTGAHDATTAGRLEAFVESILGTP